MAGRKKRGSSGRRRGGSSRPGSARLPAWVRYAGCRRGPSKTLLAAASEGGVDLADPAAIEAYVEQYNRDIAA